MRTSPLPADRPAPSDAVPCASDADLWFAERPSLLAVAQARCGGCPLQRSCLTGALERAEPWGVWGGRILVDGRVVAVKRGRGRPARRADPLGQAS